MTLKDSDILKALKMLDEAPVPKDRRFFIDENSPMFKDLKARGKLKKDEMGLWEIV